MWRNLIMKVLQACVLFAAVLCFGVVQGVADEVVRIDQVEMAGISGFRTFWDKPVMLAETGETKEMGISTTRDISAIWTGEKPGAPVFDAAHRSLLVRFPGAAETVAALRRTGKEIVKVELVLPFTGTEIQPELYRQPEGQYFLGDAWARIKPKWHAVAWALRKPWKADPKTGPTFNAYINGAGYWAKYGAADEEQDRHPQVFGPTEVSLDVPEGRLDITAMLTDAGFGASLGERLRALADCGVVVRKLESYDAAFYSGGYDYQTCTGQRGIRVKTPYLAVTVAPGKKEEIALPPAADTQALSGKLVAAKSGGVPSAVMPSDAEIAGLIQRFAVKRPAWMPDWQWARTQELLAAGKDVKPPFPQTKEAYLAWIDEQLAMLPRLFPGFFACRYAAMSLRYGDAIPAPVRDHWKLFWWAHLMPDREWSTMAHGYVGNKAVREYYDRTHDWRGNSSLYRTYCHAMGTMNFNNWSVAATLLGGAVLGNPKMIDEGRYGLEIWNLRIWSWYDGSTQESIDHYYMADSLTAQKDLADTAPERIDRMMGESILMKTVEELVSSYHPGLRRFISDSCRTGTGFLLGEQDGLQYILHSLSRQGCIADMDNKELPGKMTPLCHSVPTWKVAQQGLDAPWGPEWLAGLIDDKPLPFEMTVSYTQWGNHRAHPLWRRKYMGKNYGVASIDVATGNETVPYMAQWRRRPEQVTSAFQVGTLLARFGWNDTDFMDSVYHGNPRNPQDVHANFNPNGSVDSQGGFIVNFQHRNKTLILGSPQRGLPTGGGGRVRPEKVTSLQTSLALFSLEEKPSWEIVAGGKRVESLPVSLPPDTLITIMDGVTFLGIKPVPSTDLGRSKVVEIRDGGPLRPFQDGDGLRPTLLINNYNYFNPDKPIDPNANPDALDDAFGGFCVEVPT